MKSVNLYIPLLLLLFLAGACGTKKSDGASGALSDDALLDTVQHRTFNYFWDGAVHVDAFACQSAVRSEEHTSELQSRI